MGPTTRWRSKLHYLETMHIMGMYSHEALLAEFSEIGGILKIGGNQIGGNQISGIPAYTSIRDPRPISDQSLDMTWT